MSRHSVLMMGRTRVERDMEETVTVFRETERVDPDTFETITSQERHYPAPDSLLSVGRGSLGSPATAVSEREVAGQSVSAETRILSLPVSTSLLVQTDDIVIVVTSRSNPGLVGRRYRVTGEPAASDTVANRFPLEQIT